MIRDFRAAFRSLRNRPGYTAVIVATLAIVVGCNTAIFTLLNTVLIRPLAYGEPDRLVTVFENNRPQGLDQVSVSAPTYLDWRERSRSFDEMAAYRYLGHTLTKDDSDPERIVTLEVSPSLFRTLGASPFLGRGFVDDEETVGSAPVAILSYAAWSNRFGGDPGVLESTIRLDSQPYTVVGVMPAGFEFPPADADAEVWMPVQMLQDFQRPRVHRMYEVIGHLAPGATLDGARQELNAITADIAVENPDSHSGWGATLVLSHDQLVGDVRTMLWMLFGAVTLVLLIGCVNVANLVLARSAESSREFAIRSAFGARGFALLRLSLAEGLLLAVGGGAAGLGVAYWGVNGLRQLIPASVPRANAIEIDVAVLIFTGFISLVAGVIFGVVPALRTMRPNLIEVLQASGRGTSISRGVRRLSDFLVATEVALAVVLLVGAGMMVGSLLHLLDTDPGFRKSNVVSAVVSLPRARYPGREQMRQFYSDLVQRLNALPDVESAGAVSALPMSAVGTDFNLPFTPPGQEIASPSERPRAGARIVLPGYFQAMGIPLVRGRILDEFDGREDARRGLLINETMARLYFREVEPLGQVLAVPMMGDLEIVGIVGDVRHEGLQAEAGPELFVPFNVFPQPEMHVVAHTTGDANSMISTIRAQILQIDSQQPITKSASIERLLSTSIAQPRFNMALLIGLAFCAVVLAAVGIYAVVSYAVARRTMEIGVRMALGSGRDHTLKLIVGEALRVVAIGTAVGLAGAFGLVRLIQSLLYEVGPTDPPTYVSAVFVVVLVGLMAAVVPAVRATRVDPVVALREE